MTRRLFAIAIALCLCGWGVRAAERASFILTDGERISGTVVFHGSGRENLIDNDFSLAVTPGQPEQIFHYDQVAVIDFIGGTPRMTELEALPDNGHLLVMRNGDTRRGHFVNMIGGDTLRWQDDGGPTREMPLRDVARIYLNSASARTTFNFRAPANRQARQSVTPTPAGRQITVPTNVAWVDAGMTVRRGQRFRILGTGDARLSTNGDDVATPAGAASYRFSPKAPLPTIPVGALIARIGNGGPFPIGHTENAFTMNGSGRLFLGINDDYVPDNVGTYTVYISEQ
jgi:hypothetical protein